jgi:hypothetical protein
VIAVFVTFRYEENFSLAKVRELAGMSRAKFAGMPGLRTKLFSVSPELREARNVYIWNDEQAARAFFTPEVRERVAALYGVEPVIEYAQVCALVENAERV